ncbi:MAG TPA: hypothetical protein VJK30_00045 [Coxiellaceae bacterium]|nr:hypothetical protein [Coxiellaceae bacterium]
MAHFRAEKNNASFGLDWYLVNSIKFGLNYIYANASPSANGLNRIVNIIALRMQARFG